ncbi:MAG: NAD(P)-dependent oxidoreductase [Saprospiraceae bacterium]|nr:NAD(P)-dependent oxidoreductase [Saprospiraceae bacterium]
MKVFVTGATGIIGKRIVKQLIKHNYEVVGLARSDKNVEQLKSMGAIPRRGDLFQVQQLTDITRDCDAILHMATKIPLQPVPKAKDWAMNDRIRTEGTRNLITAAEKNDIKTFIQQSVIFTYGDQHGAKIYQDTPLPDQVSDPLLSNVEMEDILTQHPNLAYIILRFGWFYSADSAQTQDMLRMTKKGFMPVIGKGQSFQNMIHADDAAAAVVHALQNADQLQRSTFNITDFSPISLKDMITAMAAAAGGRKPMHIPKVLARLMTGKAAVDFLTASMRIQPPTDFGAWTPKYPDFRVGIEKVGADLYAKRPQLVQPA